MKLVREIQRAQGRGRASSGTKMSPLSRDLRLFRAGTSRRMRRALMEATDVAKAVNEQASEAVAAEQRIAEEFGRELEDCQRSQRNVEAAVARERCAAARCRELRATMLSARARVEQLRTKRAEAQFRAAMLEVVALEEQSKALAEAVTATAANVSAAARLAAKSAAVPTTTSAASSSTSRAAAPAAAAAAASTPAAPAAAVGAKAASHAGGVTRTPTLVTRPADYRATTCDAGASALRDTAWWDAQVTQLQDAQSRGAFY
eukprot:TRINITY_DN18655_c0_g1_i1.p1 TRINITY_DN18655_c0_g1~~TRINITY_DN18655_c0_g1_i1.p1  ORF type:complete len:285 (-),score=73.75 TRINITY_DN18655_c0_g1_i1:110-892(-)